MNQVILLSSFITILLLLLVYNHIGLKVIKDKLCLMFTRKYWEPLYNKVEFLAWMSKAIIIFPGLIFNYQIWWFFIISGITSSLLIWVSSEKALPTLIIFNSIWIFISTIAVLKHFLL